MKYSILSRLLLLAIFILSLNTFAQEQFGGLALYTVRDQMAENPKATLDTVASIGYEFVEDAGYKNGKFYGMTPEDFKMYLDEKKLIPISSHQGGITFENADSIIADLKKVGFKYLVIPVPPMGTFTYDPETHTMGMKGGVEKLAETLNTLGEKCSAAGLKLLYHNHDFEYKEDADGVIPIEYLLENCDPENVNFQMDLYWVTKAGKDPVNYFEKYPGRFKMWHVKDMDKQGRFAPVGEGTIDFARILTKKDLSGMEYYLVEQDQTFNHTPIEAIRISHDALKTLSFK